MSRQPKAQKKSQKPKKEKITYIDDGSTVADMSGTRRGKDPLLGPRRPSYGRSRPEPRTRAGQIWNTYWGAVRMMFVPMLVTIAALSVMFLLIWLIFGFFA